MEPTHRMMIIRLLEKIHQDKNTADRLQIYDISRYLVDKNKRCRKGENK